MRTVFELFGAERVVFCKTRNESPVPHHAIGMDGDGFRTYSEEKELLGLLSGQFGILADIIRTRACSVSSGGGNETIVQPGTAWKQDNRLPDRLHARPGARGHGIITGFSAFTTTTCPFSRKTSATS